MDSQLVPFIAYSAVSIFTPGPSNISASALGARVGYRKALPFIAGMVLGFAVVLSAAALLSDFLRANYAPLSGYLKWVGAAYVTWLAIALFVRRPKADVATPNELGFVSGLLLVLLNPKGILFAVSAFVSFSALLTGSWSRGTISVLFLSFLLFLASSLWAFAGAMLSRAFRSKVFSAIFNVAMALLLLYAAYSIVFL